MIIITIVSVVFLLTTIAYRSILISIRLIFTIGLTISWVFGASTLLYQDILDSGGLYWILPISCTPLMCGLTMDYDMFLISRIYEYRKRGYSTKAAILKGLHKTGGIITSAGIIMIVAFSALMLSTLEVLQQFGFVLVSCSIIDTFIVRSLFVPAIMLLGVDYNWWPGKMPKETVYSLDSDDESDVDTDSMYSLDNARDLLEHQYNNDDRNDGYGAEYSAI